MSRYHYDKQIRERRKQAGLCGCCGVEPRREGKGMCQPCADTKSAKAKAKRAEAKAAGLCGFCLKNKALGTGLTCQSCLLVKSAALRKMRKLRAEAGVCAYCGRGKQTHGVGCSTCAKKARLALDRQRKPDSAPVRKAPPKPRKQQQQQQPSKTCPLCKDKHRADSKCCPRCLAKFSARRAA